MVASAPMRCPSCTSNDDKVVDSRTSEDGAATRRRRECLACGRRFTTYERVEEVALVVVKRSGGREPFERAKIVAGLKAAAKGRPLDDEALESVAIDVEERMRLDDCAEVSSEQVGLAILDRLRDLDHVAYVRFASVYKGFDDATDFERELVTLLKK